MTDLTPQRAAPRLSVERLHGSGAAPALALRRAVFERERGAQGDADDFDALATHLILRDPDRPALGAVGALRVLDGAAYTGREFDVRPLEADGRPLAEIGRACLHPDYRGGAAGLALLGAALTELRRRGAALVTGTASFDGADPAPHLPALRALRDGWAAPPGLRPRARGPDAVAVAGPGRSEDMRAVPPLLKTYLRAGARVGEGAWVDHAFRAVDVAVVLELDRLRVPRRAA